VTLAAEHLGHFTPGSEEWMDARAAGLGGSEIAAVAGLSPWESRFSLWHRKQGLIPPQEGNEETYWGQVLEDAIARRFAANNPQWRVQRTGMWRSRARPYQFATPDRLVLGGGRKRLLECKTARHADEWGATGSTDIPVYYRCQVQWQLDTLELDTCYVTVLIAGSDYRVYRIERDLDDCAYLRSEAEAFMTSIEAGERPDIDQHGETYRVVRAQHPGIDDVDVDIDPILAEEYVAACSQLTDAEEQKRYQSARVADAMGTARRATAEGRRVAIRVPGRGEHPPSLRPSPQKPPTQASVRET
jgi:putative phage-type endonuclease